MKYILEMYRYENKILFFKFGYIFLIGGLICLLLLIPSFMGNYEVLLITAAYFIMVSQWFRTIGISFIPNLNRVYIDSLQVKLKYIVFKNLFNNFIVFLLLVLSFFFFEFSSFSFYGDNIIANFMILSIMFQSVQPITLVNSLFCKGNTAFQRRLWDIPLSLKLLKYLLLVSSSLIFISPVMMIVILYDDFLNANYFALTYFIITNLIQLFIYIYILNSTSKKETISWSN